MASPERLCRDQRLTATDFHALAERLGVTPFRARKAASVAAWQASVEERIETRWNGEETVNVARPGDWIVTSLSRQGEPLRDAQGFTNVYVIAAERFGELYVATGRSTPHGAIFQPTATVLAIHLPGGFDIMAPWGERQTGDSGYLLLNGDDVYGNQADIFEAAYEAERR